MADTAGAELLEVDHGSLVRFTLQMPEADAAQFVSTLNESGQGRIGWLKPDEL